MGDGDDGGDGDAAVAECDGDDGMALGLVIAVVMRVRDIVVIVLVTLRMKIKVDPSFCSGPLQNLSPPRRPGHPLSPKTVPPAGFPGAPGMPGPHLHYPSVWPAAQGPQWEGNIPRALTSPGINGRLGYKEAAEFGYALCPREFTVSGDTRQRCTNLRWDCIGVLSRPSVPGQKRPKSIQDFGIMGKTSWKE